MRFYFAIAIFAFACIAPATAQTELPYNAIVLGDGATVHSGPGDSHYATHQLNANDLVEVYRHDPGGWCAIRPPAKSFSLIPESAVKRLSNDVAEILADGSQAWVGTALGPVDKPLWQVKLKKGERVAIVGEASWPHPSGKSVVWLQIEPPAGEYRWIRLSNLQLPPDEDAATKEPTIEKVDYSIPPSFGKKTPPRRSPASRSSQSKTEPSFATTSKMDKQERSFGGQSLGWKSAPRPIPKKADPIETHLSGTFGSPIEVDDSRSGFVEQATFLSEQEPADSRFEAWDGRPIPAAVGPPPMDRFASLDSSNLINRQSRSYVRDRSQLDERQHQSQRSVPDNRDNSTLMSIENRLSKELLKDPQVWNLADLKFETERTKARSTDPVERLALQHVLEKISKCDNLRKGYQQASPYSAPVPSSQPVTNVNSPYDASGWLKRLANSSGSIDPHYVLQDSLGNVTHEIVGSAGLNLGAYVDKKVGVIGRRGFNRRMNLNHVTASRVVVVR